MQYQCAHCKKVFREQEAKVENWADNQSNMICPHCDVALLPGTRQPPTLKERFQKISVKHLSFCVAFMLGLLFLERRAGLPPLFPYIATLLAALGVVIHGWFQADGPEPTQTVDLMMDKSSGGNVYEFNPSRSGSDHTH
ncbi:hypothetical protein [Marinibactrum halimedae]|uniref:Uncharacterized protein n=1 Tax=Marinibactrum halimedae TaxID=1444977 RepID=A0AA37WQD5_9GAMM|nr:hypothetical protein [Marinibactrum halimedae]MCD9460202.1 hypothetical protein [Marinibactrum halimedae]GLS27966.1 hypothetical protein GCM10007877_36850 [Marinibactrum halimedae]